MARDGSGGVTVRGGQGDRVVLAGLLVLSFATIIGFTDNFVRVIAENAGLWQFHATRTVMALALLALLARPLGLTLRPRRWRPVIARSLVHGTAMVVYFGCLAFLPVAVVAAGLFTAPIFTLLISRFIYGARIGPVRIVAVLTGFIGVLLVLGPGEGQGVGPATVLPVVAGALYALGNIATREWCGEEPAEVLLAGFFSALGLFGVIGLVALSIWRPEVPAGPEGFILRGATRPDGPFLLWTFVQAAGSLLGVGMMIRAYQVAEASRVAIFEYAILPASALWTWVIWHEGISLRAAFGMALIALAGLTIALRRP